MTDATVEPISVEEAENLNPQKREEFLRNFWQVEALVVHGRLVRKKDSAGKKAGSAQFEIRGVSGPDAQPLEYPLTDLRRGNVVDHVFVGAADERLENAFVSATLQIAKTPKGGGEPNPFLLCGAPDSIRLLGKIPKGDVRQDADGGILIEESVKAEFVRQNRERYQAEAEAALVQDKERHQAEAAELKRHQEAETAEIERQHQAETAKQKQEYERALGEQERAVREHSRLQEETAHLAVQKDKLEAALKELAETEVLKRNGIDRLRALDFITDQQHKSFLGKNGNGPNKPRAGLDFQADLGGDLPKLVAAVQTRLYAQQCLYPRYLLTDFLTLLRTNDFIVLAGLSGSGKSQLVRSFADAIGGEAHIIPVKPNWTSAEDLLGYFNPLQRSYWVTPFLEALIQASRDPDRLHLICLDEMNLAHVEYYFADFLSLMEERRPDHPPKLQLYSTHEEDQLISEVRFLLKDALRENPVPDESSFDHLMSKEAFRQRLKKVWGDEAETAEYQGRLRRMVSGLLHVPADFPLPVNVRLLGSVNFDETTHSLAPKVLDRAHVLKFVSPLEYPGDGIKLEVEKSGGLRDRSDPLPERVLIAPNDLDAQRTDYPKYELHGEAGDDTTVTTLKAWREAYLAPLGRDIGLRTVRQAIHYRNLYLEAVSQESGETAQNIVLNNLLLHKILPRFSFDGNSPLEVIPKGTPSAETTAGGDLGTSQLKKSLIEAFRDEIGNELGDLTIEEFSVPQLKAFNELNGLINRASGSDDIFNYWS